MMLALLSFLVVLAPGQGDLAVVEGRVVDELGGAVAGAIVRFEPDEGERAETATDGAGRFELSVPSSRGFLRIRHPGFAEAGMRLDDTGHEERRVVLELARFAEQIAVTATRRERSLFETASSVSVVTSQDMDDRALATTPDALEGMAGVLVQRTTLGGGSPILRGLVGNQVLVLVDGVRMNNSTYRLGPNQYLNTVDRFSASRVEVVRGPTSSLYGSDALGGTVNVLTEPLPRDGQGLRPRVALGYDGATRAPIVSARVGGEYRDLGFTGGGTYASFGDLHGGSSTGRQTPTGFERRAGDLKLGYALGGAGRITGVAQVFEDQGVPRFDRIASGADELHLFSPQRRVLGYVRYEGRLGFLGGASLSTTFSRLAQTEGRRIRGAGSSTLSLERDEVTTYGAGVFLAWPERRRMEWGAGVELYDDAVASRRARRNVESGAETPVRGRFPDGSSYRSTAAYAQVDVRASARWHLRLGGRLNGFRAAAALEGFDDAYEASFGASTGSASLRFELSDHVQVSGGVAQGFRAPGLDDATVFGEFNAGIEVPNPDLRPESLLNYELTMKALYPALAASFTVFDSHLEGLIAREPGLYQGSPTFQGQRVFQRQNIDRARISGAEAELHWWPANAWSLFTSFSVIRGTNETDGTPLRRIPPALGTLRLRRYVPAASSWIELETRIASKQDRLSPGDVADSRIPEGGTRGFVVLSVSSRVALAESWSLDVVLHNLTNADYRSHGSGINGAGRSLRVQLGLEWN